MFKVCEGLSGLLKAMPACILLVCLLQEDYGNVLSIAVNKIISVPWVHLLGVSFFLFSPSFLPFLAENIIALTLTICFSSQSNYLPMQRMDKYVFDIFSLINEISLWQCYIKAPFIQYTWSLHFSSPQACGPRSCDSQVKIQSCNTSCAVTMGFLRLS